MILTEPAWLWLALIAALPFLLRVWTGAKRRPHVDHAMAERIAREVPSSWRARLAFVPALLTMLTIFSIVVALARPKERRLHQDESRGIDILLCLDTSSSMAALDMSPQLSRLELAKRAAARFITGRPKDAIGLLRFARFADLVCPTTRDHRALLEMLEAVDRVEADGPEDRTGIGSAIGLAAKTLRSTKTASRVLVLLTDGEENVATTATPDEIGPLRAAELCRDFGIRVYAIAAGIGKQDEKGAFVPLDTTQLEGVAAATGGAFFAAKDERAIDAVYDRIDELETTLHTTPRVELIDRHRGFVWLALALFSLYQISRTMLWRRLP